MAKHLAPSEFLNGSTHLNGASAAMPSEGFEKPAGYSAAPIGAGDAFIRPTASWRWLHSTYATAASPAPPSNAAQSGDASSATASSTTPASEASIATLGGGNHAWAGAGLASATSAGQPSFESFAPPRAAFNNPETVTLSGSGLVFVNTYSAGVTDAFHTAIIFAENELQSHFTNPVTIRVSYDFANLGPGFLASNSFFNVQRPDYATLKTALTSHATSAADLAAVAALPLTAPSNAHSSSATTNFLVAAGMARILGLQNARSTLDDALVLGSAFTWNFDPNNRGAAGGFDAIGAIEHEITEGGMGRVGGLGFQNNTWAPMDLFRFNSAGVRDFTGGQDGVTTYFSPSGLSPDLSHPYHSSVNSLGQFDGFDPADWEVGGDSFGFGSPGVPGLLSATDLAVMDVIGWDLAPCFVRGTLIRTESGEVPVEELAIGDFVVTAAGASRPIRWIGRRAYDPRFIAGNRKVLPIRIAVAALAEGVPARDLWLSPEHALYIDGLLVVAKHLVNGATIIQAEHVDRLEYFNIEFDAQEVIFAEGAPAETYVDCDNRLMFANAPEYAALYPDDERPRWQFCAPRPDRDTPEVTAVRAALLERTGALGYGITTEPDLHLLVDGQIARPQSAVGGNYEFAVPAGAGTISIVSRHSVPAESEPAGRDIRRLGVAVERIMLSDGHLATEVRHSHPALDQGFHEAEPTHRWTNGQARLPGALLRPFEFGFSLRVQLADTALAYRIGPKARSGATAVA